MKIGFMSLPLFGHLNPMTALARKLQSRGNEIVFITVPDAEPVLRAANLNFVTFCEEEYPPVPLLETGPPLQSCTGRKYRDTRRGD